MTAPFFLSYGALWALVVLLSLVVLGLVRTVYRLQRDGVAGADAGGRGMRGRPVPEFAAVDIEGRPVRSDALSDRVYALLFVGSDCASCALTLHDLDALHVKADRNVIVVCQGDAEACGELAENFRITAPVIADADFDLSNRFEITTVPTAIIVSAGGTISSVGHPLGAPQLEELISQARRDEGEPQLVVHGPGEPREPEQVA